MSDSITIDLNDLKDGSHLKALLESQQKAALSIASELAKYAGQPIQAALGSNPAKISISAPTNWKTSTGIGFSLTPTATCSVSIAKSSTKFAVAKSIDSTETNDIVSGPSDGKVYVNIDLDFSITGSVSGSGSVSGIGISGKGTGSASTTLSYCHAVDPTTETLSALKDAFSNLVFPFEPNCALKMGAGDVGRVNFDGSLGFDLAVSYGLASYKFSAPGVDSVQTSMQRGVEKLTIPTVDVEAGAKASFSYTHSDHFGAIIQKVDPQNATMYLVRSAASEVGASVGVTVGISVTPKTASVDKNALAAAVNVVTGSGGDKAAALGDQLESSLVSRTTAWLSGQNGDASLLVKLSRQAKRALLYAFKVDLSNPAATEQSWADFAKGDLAAAVQIGGLTLLPGSGVSSELKRSVSIGLHFFNFFSVTDASVYFQNSYTEIGPDGSIRYLYDVGKESDEQTKKTLVTSRIHFVASLTQADKNNIKNVAVDLCMELSESNKVNDGNAIAAVISSLPPSVPLNTVETAMRNFVAQSPKGTLTLATVLKGSAYGRLTCSQFTGAKHDIPPAPPQTQDQANWYAYRDAARSLQGLNYVSSLTYEDWEVFNQYSNYGKPSGAPNRRADGSPDAVPPSFYSDRNIGSNAGFVSYFLRSSSHFMNLCDDLVALAGTVGTIDTITGWNRLLKDLTILAKSLMSDWTRPSACALFGQCGVGATVQSNIQPGGKAKAPSLTCTVTVN